MIKKLKRNAKRNNRFYWYEEDFVRWKENIKFYGNVRNMNYIYSHGKRGKATK